MDIESLAHTKWRCKYHVVFAPKYRRQIIYGKIKQDIGAILRNLCERKRGECMYRSYPYVNKRTAKNKHIKFYGLFEG